MIGLLREGWKSGRLSPDKTMEALEHDFGRRDGTPYSGAIFAMEPEPDGTVHADMVLTSGASAGGGLDYVQMGAAACVRLSGRPAPDPAVTVSDVTCPDGVAANNVVVVKVGKSS
ncbi:hypothetical protein OG589_33795 [Sphaerisporangium sp. NBC_01403]|uniref:hypothetical protein n=1 Tax=Sphaerisporangium sp. NBC_01403 TaxID=2903599 RepID=UPI00324D3897